MAEIRGVRYFNDSKATNVDATLKALDAFPGRILIILGGKDKGSDYTLLQNLFAIKPLALLIGAASEKIESQIAGSVPLNAQGPCSALWQLLPAREPGDIVLLGSRLRQLRSVSELRASRPGLQATGPRTRKMQPGNFGKGIIHLARRSDTDRWLFLSPLCFAWWAR